jgi:hypothetical protein
MAHLVTHCLRVPSILTSMVDWSVMSAWRPHVYLVARRIRVWALGIFSMLDFTSVPFGEDTIFTA